MNAYFKIKTLDKSEKMYIYDGGVYSEKAKPVIKRIAYNTWGDLCNRYILNELYNTIHVETYVPEDFFEKNDDINLIKHPPISAVGFVIRRPVERPKI